MREGVRYYLIHDQVGTLRAVADAGGNVVKSIEYDTFGNILVDSNLTFEVPFGFAGGFYDRNIGLVRFGYRDYDPDIGRWTAKDPIGFAGGDTDLYGYVLNDPIQFIDPRGELAFLTGVFIVAGSTAVISAAIHFIISKPEWEVNEKIIESYVNHLKMQNELEKRERDPCLTDKPRREIEKFKRENLRRLEYLLKLMHEKGIDLGRSFAEYQYFPYIN